MTKISATPVNFVPAYANSTRKPLIYIYRTGDTLVEVSKIDLGVRDISGRKLGHRVTISLHHHVYGTEEARTLYETDKADLLIGDSYLVSPHSLRDGRSFGGMPAGKRVKTLAEAYALRDAIFAKARKTASKKKGVVV